MFNSKSFKYFLSLCRISFSQILTVSSIIWFSSLDCYCQNGLMAEYFDGKDFDRFVSAAYVDNIDDSWNYDPPVSGIDPHYCSIRWTGKLRPRKTATYLFSAVVDDGIRVWIDGEVIINQWNLNDYGIFNGNVDLEANEEYNIKVEYFNALREAEIKLLWDIEIPKKDQSWYERVFGVEYKYQVIHSDFFVRPEEPLPIAEDEKEAPIPTTLIKEEKKVTPVAVKEKEKKNVPPIPTPKPAPKVKTVAAAEKYIPKNVQFVRAKAEILPSSNAELNTFSEFMIDHPHVTVTIEGHTDVVGIESQNQFLSERRANKVARYLVKQGIAGKRIKTKGYGGSRPLKIPEEGEYHPPNRRVVFILRGIE